MTETRTMIGLFVALEVLWIASMACLANDRGAAGAALAIASLVPLLGFVFLTVRRFARRPR